MATDKDSITLGSVTGLALNRNTDERILLDCLQNFSLDVTPQIREIICAVRDGVADIRRFNARANISFDLIHLSPSEVSLIFGEDWEPNDLSQVRKIGDGTNTPTRGDNPEWRLDQKDGDMTLKPRHVSTWSMSSSGEGAGSGAPSGSSSNGDVYYDRDNDNFWIYSDGTLFNGNVSSGWHEINGYDETRSSSAGTPSQSPNSSGDMWLVVNIDDSNTEIDAIGYYSTNGTDWDVQTTLDSEFDYEAVDTFGGSAEEVTVYWADNVILDEYDIEPIEWEGVTGKNPSFPSTDVASDEQMYLWSETNGTSPFSFTEITTRLDGMSKPTWSNPNGKTDVAFEDWEVDSVNGSNPDGYTVGDNFATFGKQFRILNQMLGKVRIYVTGDTAETVITSFDREQNYEVFGDIIKDRELIQGDTVLRYGVAYSYDGIRNSAGNLISNSRQAIQQSINNAWPLHFWFEHDFQAAETQSVYKKLMIRLNKAVSDGSFSMGFDNSDNLITVTGNYQGLKKSDDDIAVELEFIDSDQDIEDLADFTV